MSRPALLAFALLVAALAAGARWAERTGPAFAALPAALEGRVVEGGGWYPGEPLVTTVPVRAWGTHAGDDDHRGTLALGPFPAPRRLQFAVGGYPAKPGNTLALELAATRERIPLPVSPDVGERWRLVSFDLPVAWRGQPVVLHAADAAGGPGGWLAVSEPVRGGRGAAHHAFLISLAGFAANALFLALLALPALRWLAARDLVAPAWQPLAAAAAVAAAAYAVFWAYFAAPWLGHAVTTFLILTSLVHALRRPLESSALDSQLSALGSPLSAPSATAVRHVAALMAVVGVFYLALLHLYPSPLRFDDLAGNRFREAMPSDNVLPFDLASRLHAGLSPTAPGAEWQSSDRPPLQSGWQLLVWNATALLGLDARTASGTAAMWFQLLWIPAAYALLRTLRLAPDRAAAWTAALSLTGFFLQNTVFTWPKLASAAFLLGAWAQWFAPPADRPRRRADYALGAALAALAWLAHGGVAFALLALAPAVVLPFLRPASPIENPKSKIQNLRGWLLAALVFLAFAVPWLAYQRFYEPPANRLLKWHLAGQDARDARTLGETLRANYGALTWSEIADRRLANLRVQFAGNWRALGDFSARDASARRHDEFFFTFRTLAWWNAGAALLAVALFRRSGRALLAPATRLHLGLAAWTVLTLLVWCALMFTGLQAVIHQGSYTTVLVLFVLLCVWCEAAGSGFVLLVAALQSATLAANYGRPNAVVSGDPAGLPVLLLAAVPLAAFLLAPFRARLRDLLGAVLAPLPAPARPAPTPSPPAARLWPWVLLAAAALALRKPWALHTPQLWAEDGSIFLLQDGQLGVSAWWTPYGGYLLLVPRLIAWLARVSVDVAWWPAVYNGGAFLCSVAVFARLASPRVRLPAKPGLMLAFALVAGTGETLLNITNLQWFTAFFLLLQLFTAPAVTFAQRLGDLALLLLVGLNGPFALVFLPLFAWRAWADRPPDFSLLRRPAAALLHVLPLLAVAACAAVQARFLLGHGLSLDGAAAPQPFRLQTLLTVVGHRLVTWPVFGPAAVRAWPHSVHIALGLVGLGALLLLAARRDALRPVRLTLAAAFVVVTVAGVFRVRVDSWSPDDFVNGDRYFFIPRLLLAWLVLVEWDHARTAVRWTARALCLAAVATNAPHYVLPAPPDYQWARHCAPIRLGKPANIPTLPEGWIFEYPGR